MRAETVSKMDSYENPSLVARQNLFSEPKSTDSSAMGFWTDARTDAILKKLFFKNPFYDGNPKKKGYERTLTPSAKQIKGVGKSKRYHKFW